MSSPRLILALWLIQPVIQAAIAVILYRRKLHKEFPAFFTYIAVQLPLFCIELPSYYFWGGSLHFVVYWAATAVNLLLTFRIIHEIFLDVFKPYHALKDLGSALFKWASIIMVLVSVILISVTPRWENPVVSTILVIQRGVGIVQCGLVIFLLAFCRNLGVNWRRLSFGVALGFGIMSGSELLTVALYSGKRIQVPAVQSAVMMAYDFGMLVWVFYSAASRRADMVPVLIPQRWDEALADIQPPPSDADSLIPMFEHMVDQALSKSPAARH